MTRLGGLKKAQVTLEYAMVAICIIAALLAMQFYIKRAAQGRLREAADAIGEQYDARHINSTVISTQVGRATILSQQVREPSQEAEEGRIDGVRTSVVVQGEVIGKTGNETLQRFPTNLYD